MSLRSKVWDHTAYRTLEDIFSQGWLGKFEVVMQTTPKIIDDCSSNDIYYLFNIDRFSFDEKKLQYDN